jgi:hypothetical protein
MEIKDLTPPKLPVVHMVCDDIIDDKLTRFPAVEACFSTANFSVIAGLMGQGKTSLAINLLRSPFKKCFHHIYVIIPEVSLASIAPKDNIFVKHLDEDHLYHEYNADVLEEIYQKVLQHSRDKEHSILLVDDYGAMFSKDKEAGFILNKMITKMRHLKTTILLLAQNIYQLPRKWRELATNLITHNLGKSQMTKIFDEFYQYSPEQIREIMTLYKDPHDWLILNLKYNRLFYKFDKEIMFKEKATKERETKVSP